MNLKLIYFLALILVITFNNYAKLNINELQLLSPEDIIEKNKKHIINLIKNQITNRKETVFEKRLLDFFSIDKITKELFQKNYSDIFVFAEFMYDYQRTQILIQDTVLFSILVASLDYDNEKISSDAFSRINSYGRRDLIYAFSDPIKKAIVKNKKNNYINILMHCNLSKKERAQYLERKGLSIYYYAALGDSSALDSLITEFDKCNDFRKKKDLANQLARIGNRKCITTLFNALEDTLSLIGRGGKEEKSFRLEILKALKHTFPDEKIFTTIPYQIFRFGQEYYEKYLGKRSIEEYLEKVEKWIYRYNGNKINIRDGRPLAKYTDVE